MIEVRGQSIVSATHERLPVPIIVVSESLVQFSGFSEFGGENPQISLKFGANRANT